MRQHLLSAVETEKRVGLAPPVTGPVILYDVLSARTQASTAGFDGVR